MVVVRNAPLIPSHTVTSNRYRPAPGRADTGSWDPIIHTPCATGVGSATRFGVAKMADSSSARATRSPT